MNLQDLPDKPLPAEVEDIRENYLFNYDGPDRIVSLKEALELHKGSDSVKMFTGIPDLDTAVDGVESGEVIVISGPTKHGKTLLAETIAYHISRSKAAWQNPPLFFSFEMGIKQFAKKYGDDIPNYKVPLELVRNNPVWLEEKIAEGMVKFGCHTVFIDHLHFLVDMMQLKNPSLDIGKVMRYLKQNIALHHNVAVFLIAHTTKSKQSPDQQSSVSDVRDSSFVSQEADSTWMVRRRRKPPNSADILVCNHRRTGVFEHIVRVVKAGTFLEPLEWRPEYDEG